MQKLIWIVHLALIFSAVKYIMLQWRNILGPCVNIHFTQTCAFSKVQNSRFGCSYNSGIGTWKWLEGKSTVWQLGHSKGESVRWGSENLWLTYSSFVVSCKIRADIKPFHNTSYNMLRIFGGRGCRQLGGTVPTLEYKYN